MKTIQNITLSFNNYPVSSLAYTEKLKDSKSYYPDGLTNTKELEALISLTFQAVIVLLVVQFTPDQYGKEGPKMVIVTNEDSIEKKMKKGNIIIKFPELESDYPEIYDLIVVLKSEVQAYVNIKK